jgi:uncharacterized membrane protein
MEGFAVLIVLIILFILFLPIIVSSGRFSRLDKSINEVHYELRNLRKEIGDLHASQSGTEKTEEKNPLSPQEIAVKEPEPIPQEIETPPAPVIKEESVVVPELSEITIAENQLVSEEVFEEKTPRKVLQPVAEKIVKPAKDWEKFIGENLINKIGIAILTLGIGVFVKYAIDKDWINEVGRVVIGFFAAALLLGIAHYMRKTYAAFSSVLVGGAIATMYFTVGIAFHEYKMFGQTQAFLLMCIITIFSVFISIAYNRIELAVIAQTGGFLTPFMVSTGEGNYIVLFSYLLILNLGLLVLAWYRNWRLVYIVSYVFTVLIFSAWLINNYNVKLAMGALLFATAFYFLFSAAATVFTLRKQDKLKALQFIVLLSVNMLYFFAGLYIFSGMEHGKYKGLFTALLGIVNFAVAFVLYKKDNLDKNFIYLLIGLVLTYVTLVAPIQLNGNKITLFWAAEMVILMFIYTKSNIKLLHLASLIIWPMLLISLMMDWSGYSLVAKHTPIFNRFFISGVFSLVAMYLYIRMQLKNNEPNSKTFLHLMVPVAAVVGFVTGLLEIHHQFANLAMVGGSVPPMLPDLIFAFAYILVMQWISKRRELINYGVVGIIVFVILLIIHLFSGNFAIINTIDQKFANYNYPSWPFYLHYLLWPLWVINFYFAILFIQKRFEKRLALAYWITAVFALFFISAEADYISIWLLPNHAADIKNYSDLYYTAKNTALNFTHKSVYPVIWGISAFVVMYLGLKFKKRSLRVLSLCIFGAILLKLFLIDIRSISEGGRIMAFITLGIILLVVSFLYQKLKILLAKDEINETNNEK